MSGEQTASSGIIFNIQRYSIHDGPGIRTTIFLKGCPLKCKWCANPESIKPNPEIFVRKTKCERCEKCSSVCTEGAISYDETSVQINRSKCNLCMKCTTVCTTEALTQIGKTATVNEIVEEIMKDELFYNNSGGGVTISGGEPLFQSNFTLKIFKDCKANSIHTTLDTTGYAKWEDIEEVLKYTDLVLYDIKHLNQEQHKNNTNIDNELILENFNKILERDIRVWVRIPIIPNFNSSAEYINKLGKYLSEKQIQKVSLLKYHEYGKHKYGYLGKNYPLNNIQKISDEVMEELKAILESYGLEVTLNY